MRIAPVLVCCLLLSGLAGAECVEVTRGVSQASSQKLRITTVVNSKARAAVRVIIYRLDTQTGLDTQTNHSFISDENGVVVPQEVAPGSYGVVAVTDDAAFRGELLLEISHGAKNEITEFFISLSDVRPPSPGSLPALTTGELIAGTKKAVSAHVQQFRGVLVDPSGAPISGADVVIVTTRSAGGSGLVELKSGEDGRFSAELPAGTYVAFFRMAGFRAEVMAFEVGKNGSKDMHILLKVGSC